MKHFKRLTQRWPVIMGRKTWESLPEEYRPLPNRTNVVITSEPDDQTMMGARFCDNLEWVLEGESHWNQVWIIGGASIYEQMVDKVDKMYLTLVDGDFDGDTFFPQFDESEWNKSWIDYNKDATPVEFWCYERIKS
jgi:dihydrofolate reductase